MANSVKQDIVFASANAGKIAELNDLLSPLGYRVLAQSVFGVDAVDETATTFVENALLKARAATLASGLPAIADDSGLEVDALNGAPGLYSARFAAMNNAGEGDTANNALLLKKLHGLPTANRRARFRSVVVLLRHEFDPSPIISEDTWEGYILEAEAGDGGFGYDPIFCNDDTGTAAALLDKATKNRLSHRGKAVANLTKHMADQTIFSASPHTPSPGTG